jgi:hypothetical protein
MLRCDCKCITRTSTNFPRFRNVVVEHKKTAMNRRVQSLNCKRASMFFAAPQNSTKRPSRAVHRDSEAFDLTSRRQSAAYPNKFKMIKYCLPTVITARLAD